MKHQSILFISLLFCTLFTSCLQWAEIRLEPRDDDLVTTDKIKSFMDKNPNPSIVLRVPSSEQQSTQANPNGYIYNVIEKELVKAGFDVKDRGLYNEVMTKSQDIDYAGVESLTGVQLILELVQVDRSIEYKTNRGFDGDKTIVFQDYMIRMYGAAIEFKLIIVEDNVYGGSYSFYYMPCEAYVPNCDCYVGYKAGGARVYPNLEYCNTDKNIPFESTEQNRMEDLVRNGVQKMIYELKNS